MAERYEAAMGRVWRREEKVEVDLKLLDRGTEGGESPTSL